MFPTFEVEHVKPLQETSGIIEALFEYCMVGYEGNA